MKNGRRVTRDVVIGVDAVGGGEGGQGAYRREKT